MNKTTLKIQINTKAKILTSAKKLFLKQGFDAASIGEIAKLAKVNKALVFHHYGNKEKLWISVKNDVLEGHKEPEYDKCSAKAYFESIIEYRFALYKNNPDLARLVQWQQVSQEQEVLIGNDFASPNHWLADIKNFQKKGEIKKTIKAELIMLFIIYSSYAPFMQHIFKMTKKDEENYKQIILNSCISQFT